MLPSKPRSGSSEISQKNPSLVTSKTISASKHNKGNALTSEFYSKSGKSLQQKPSKITNLPEKRIARVSEKQQHIGQLEEELKKVKEQLGVAEEERDQALDELREMKKVAQEATTKLSEAMSPGKVSDTYTELNVLKESLSSLGQELKIKEENIESLSHELEKAKQLELKLAEKDVALNKLTEKLNNVKTSEDCAMGLLSESKRRIDELEAEIGKGTESETKMFDSLVSQTKELEQTKISLEESKNEIASLCEKLEKLEGLSGKTSSDLNASQSCLENTKSMEEPLENLKYELQLLKENLGRAQEGEKLASLKAESLIAEMGLLKTELKLATEAEERSKNAMDDLALALKEVATEASQVKEKLNSTQAELEHAKGEAEQLKEMLKSTEDNYKGLLDETKKESDQFKNTIERLRLEAEESLLAWNGKEIGFVSCIKIAEEERAAGQQENKMLLESLLVAEKMTKAAKEETHRLRDILKQALIESNVAKEAAGIAKAENSQLKDFLAVKDDALDFLTQQNESLRINEAAALENIKELKQLLSAASTMELKTEDIDQGGKLKKENSSVKEHMDGKKLGKAFSFDLKKLKLPNKQKDVDEDHDDALKGSIFDIAESPQPVPQHYKKSSSAFTDDGETKNSDDFDHLDVTQLDDMASSRKKRALLRRFRDLIRRSSFHRKQTSIG